MSDALGGDAPVSGDVGESVTTTASEPTVGTSGDGTTYSVVVDGETVNVSLDELTKGYMRNADYTRKTQGLAEQRKEVDAWNAFRNALNEDPASVLAELQETFADRLAAAVDDSELDPIERELREVKQFISAQQERESQQQIDAELAALHKQFGDFDEDALFAKAIQTRNPSLRGALLEHLYEQGVVAPKSAGADEAEAELEAKRQAALVAGGHGNAAGSVNAGGASRPNSVAEAFANAKKQLGL